MIDDPIALAGKRQRNGPRRGECLIGVVPAHMVSVDFVAMMAEARAQPLGGLPDVHHRHMGSETEREMMPQPTTLTSSASVS